MNITSHLRTYSLVYIGWTLVHFYGKIGTPTPVWQLSTKGQGKFAIRPKVGMCCLRFSLMWGLEVDMCWGPPRTRQEQLWWCTDVYKNYIQIYVSFPDASLMSERCEPGGFSVHGCCPGRNAQSIPSLIGINHNSQQLSDCWRLGPLDSYMADVPLDQQEHLRWVTGSTSLEHFQYWTCVARPSRSTMLWLRSERRFTLSSIIMLGMVFFLSFSAAAFNDCRRPSAFWS